MDNVTLSNAAIEARRAYEREWRRNNPDKVKINQQKYWERKAAALQAQQESEENHNAT